MNFYIQASNPSFIIKSCDTDEATLDEYIESIFELNTENAIIQWSGTFIPLNYKYTISSIMKDILIMLNKLQSRNGKYKINWPCSEFLSVWNLKWNNSEVFIQSEWVSVIGNTEDALNKNSKIIVKKNEFISEWKKLIEVVYNGLVIAGYSFSDVLELKLLEETLNKIDNYGVLYQ